MGPHLTADSTIAGAERSARAAGFGATQSMTYGAPVLHAGTHRALGALALAWLGTAMRCDESSDCAAGKICCFAARPPPVQPVVIDLP